MSKPKHSPLPWHPSKIKGRVEADDGTKYHRMMPVCVVGWEHGQPQQANLELIVRAVNAHDDLLAACKAELKAQRQCFCSAESGCARTIRREIMEKAVAKAEGGAK